MNNRNFATMMVITVVSMIIMALWLNHLRDGNAQPSRPLRNAVEGPESRVEGQTR